MRAVSRALWTPAQITTGLWLDAADNTTVFSDAGTTQAIAGTSTIQQWNDKSGNARHVTQSTSLKRPSYTLNGLNSQNVVSFVDDALYNAALDWATGTHSLFAVFRRTEGINFQTFIASGAGETARFAYGTAAPPPSFSSKYSIFRIAEYHAEFTQAWGNANILSFASSGSPTSTLIVNSGSPSTVTIGGAVTTAAGIFIGSNSSFSEPTQGYFAEIIVMLSAASTGTRETVEGYLAHKWGLTANLPSGHPHKTTPPYA